MVTDRVLLVHALLHGPPDASPDGKYPFRHADSDGNVVVEVMDLITAIVKLSPAEVDAVLVLPWIDKGQLVRALMPRSLFSSSPEIQRKRMAMHMSVEQGVVAALAFRRREYVVVVVGMAAASRLPRVVFQATSVTWRTRSSHGSAFKTHCQAFLLWRA